MRNSKGQFVKGITPYNKMTETVCIIEDCDRTDMKAYGLCNKHYKRLQLRRKNGQDISNLKDRLPRTKEHIEKQRLQRLGKSNSLKGKTYEEIHGVDKAKARKEHMSKVLKGKNLGRVSPTKGTHLSDETKEKLRKKMTGKFSKEKNYFWNGGSSYEKYDFKFTHSLKETIRVRDNRKCQECGCDEKEIIGKLCVHHIDENKSNTVPENLISLCRSCHMKAHYTKGEWKKYFNNIIKEKQYGPYAHNKLG